MRVRFCACTARPLSFILVFFFFNDTATTEIYTRSIVGSVRCVQETGVVYYQNSSSSSESDCPKTKQHTTATTMAIKAVKIRQTSSLSVLRVRVKYARWPFTLFIVLSICCLLYTSPSPRDLSTSRMPSSA
eukprot:TRINITY_DN28726_c0_g1_i1.p3 TRINITY_DN28726_c0_g1~~TRINITY_DN28726_c0_g1_i1.p3  ORF type:complete len:131 (+),score=17.50 TRINITY_DN28726_c0_g1_i1:71-463(+)